ncbi:MAG: hypothetical protein IJB24_02905 [Clostridia bacterium]|nr:hypothetical protein [Clostridia bacterium]
MRRTKRTGNFLLTLLFNMLLNLEWGIPALVLLILHFVIGLSIWWFVGAMAFWILCMITGMWIIGWARDCGDTPDPPKENKNPYSYKK